MNYTREEQFTVIVSRVNAADGNVADEEVKMMFEVGVANGLNQEAMNTALENIDKYDFEDVVNSTLEDDEIQDIIFKGCTAAAKADGKISIEEIQIIHVLGEYFEWMPAFVTYNIINMFKENPELEIEISE